MPTVRHLPTIVAAVVFFAIGAIWYNVLSVPWLAGIGKSMEQLTREQGSSPLPYVVGFVAILVMCYTLAWLIARLDANTLGTGLQTGIIVALGFNAATLALNYGFESRSPTLWAINAGYVLVGLAISGAILGGWRRSR